MSVCGSGMMLSKPFHPYAEVVVALERLARRWQAKRAARWGSDAEAREVKPWVVRVACLAVWLAGVVVLLAQGNVGAAVGLIVLPVILSLALQFLARVLIKRMTDKHRT